MGENVRYRQNIVHNVYYTDNGGSKQDACMSSSQGDLTAIVASAVQKYADIAGGLMPLLHEIQAGLGYIPKDSVATIARGMGLSRAEVHGVISFYHDFHDQPRGQTTIHLCRAEACQAMGSRKLEQHVKTRLNIDFGGTNRQAVAGSKAWSFEKQLPFSIGIRLGRGFGAPTGFYGNFFARLSPAPNRVFGLLLQNHMVAEEAREPDLREG